MHPIDNAVVDATTVFLRRCLSGGMKRKDADTILTNIKAAAELAYFSMAVSEHGKMLLEVIRRQLEKDEQTPNAPPQE